ncbi:MAG TPA: GDP-mannose 4,6-dehydratase, partial [Candidatus Binatia bacterium]
MISLVTGVAGFVGSHLAERLLAEGHTVRGVDKFLDNYPRRFKDWNLAQLSKHPRFEFVDKDLVDLDLV